MSNHITNKSELNTTENKIFTRKSQSHSYDVDNACLYGVECAILINHFIFWIEQNQTLGRNFHDGRTWMYQTQKEIAAIYPYWSEDTIFRNIKKLVDEGVLIKGNYNKTSFDKTIWYAFKNEEMFTKPRNRGIDNAIPRNQFRKVAEPIPDTKTNTKKIHHHQDPKKQQTKDLFPDVRKKVSLRSDDDDFLDIEEKKTIIKDLPISKKFKLTLLEWSKEKLIEAVEIFNTIEVKKNAMGLMLDILKNPEKYDKQPKIKTKEDKDKEAEEYIAKNKQLAVNMSDMYKGKIRIFNDLVRLTYWDEKYDLFYWDENFQEIFKNHIRNLE